MPTKYRYVEKLTILALVTTVAMSFYYWDFVHKAFTRTHNTLGETNVHVPTADLFLWFVFPLIPYFGPRFWPPVGAPHSAGKASGRQGPGTCRIESARGGVEQLVAVEFADRRAMRALHVVGEDFELGLGIGRRATV